MLKAIKIPEEAYKDAKKLIKKLEEVEGEYQHTYIKISGKVLRTESRGMAIVFNEDYEISAWQGEKTVEH